MYSELIKFSYLLAQNNITTNHPAPWCERWGASGTSTGTLRISVTFQKHLQIKVKGLCVMV